MSNIWKRAAVALQFGLSGLILFVSAACAAVSTPALPNTPGMEVEGTVRPNSKAAVTDMPTPTPPNTSGMEVKVTLRPNSEAAQDAAATDMPTPTTGPKATSEKSGAGIPATVNAPKDTSESIRRRDGAGGDDQAPPLPEKGDLKYPNLGSRLDGLVAGVEAGQATAQDAAADTPVHSGESVAVTIYLTGNVDDVVSFLEDNGGDPRNVGEDYIEAYVPVTLLGRLSEQPGVIRVREIVPPQPAYGPITSQGVQAHAAAAWHQAGITGQGIKLGIIDIGFEGFSGLMGTELPVGFQARCYTDLGVSSDELADCEIDGVHGNASTETVIDVAPDVSLYLTNPQSHADMRDAVNWMISEDVSVINASISWWFDGPGDGTSPYSTGLVNTVERAVEDDIVWVTSAGNSARHTWFGTFSDPDSNGLLNFQGFEERNFLRIGDGTSLLDYPFAVDLRWEDNWVLEDGTLGGAASNLDVFVVDGATNKIVASGRDPQSGGPGHIPQELFGLESFNEPPTGSSYYIFVSLVEGEPPDWVQMTLNHAGPELQLYTLQGSIKNPAEGKNPGMLAVGAAHWDDVHAIEPYSSRGPTPDGRVKPDIVGAACGATSQYPLSEYNSGYCGTSQASPHVAGLATLVRQRFPSYTPAQVASYLKDNAEQRQSPDPNSTWGHGFIKLPPPDGTTTPVPTPSNAFTRNPAADFNTLAGASNFRPGGIWSDGETMWVSDPVC